MYVLLSTPTQEILARCTLAPDTVKWRWKQVLR